MTSRLYECENILLANLTRKELVFKDNLKYMFDLDIKINNRFYQNFEILKKKTDVYKSKVRRSKTFLKSAKSISKEDINSKINQFSKRPSPKEAIFLLRNLLNSGAWIGQSSLRYMISLIDFTNKGDLAELTPAQNTILKNVSLSKVCENVTEEDIFKVIYNEIEYSHYFPEHKSIIHVPKIDCTVVLIPGVFNELFSTPAFERAALHLNQKYNIDYYSPKISGFKSCAHNAKILERQIKSYTRRFPHKKLWFIAYSKGGLDSLHFLANCESSISKNILGITTIASPIMGSDHLNSGVIKLLNTIHNFSETKIYKAINEKTDVMAKELQNSVSSTYQRPWLRNHYEALPKNIFYTALGFESSWYESHIWMLLAKGLFKSRLKNDGVVDAENALFPNYFKQGLNLGIIKGHHLVGTRSSYFCQEALLESIIIFLNYKKLIS